MKLSEKFTLSLILSAYVVNLGVAFEVNSNIKNPISRLDRYKNGGVIFHLPQNYQKGAKSQCLIEDPNNTLTYIFRKSDDVSAIQHLFFGKSQDIKIGTMPTYKLIEKPCSEVSVNSPKWNSFEEYLEDNREMLNEIKSKVSEIANERDTRRYSYLYARTAPAVQPEHP